jgi:hypothetical protein
MSTSFKLFSESLRAINTPDCRCLFAAAFDHACGDRLGSQSIASIVRASRWWGFFFVYSLSQVPADKLFIKTDTCEPLDTLMELTNVRWAKSRPALSDNRQNRIQTRADFPID